MSFSQIDDRAIVIDRNRQAAGGSAAVRVGNGVAEQEIQVVLVTGSRQGQWMIEGLQQREGVCPRRQVSQRQGKNRRFPCRGCQRQAICADAVDQCHATGCDRRQTCRTPGEATGTVRPEAVTQHAADTSAFACYVIRTPGDTTGQAFLIHRPGIFAGCRQTIDHDGGCRLVRHDRLCIRKLWAGVEALGRETDHRVKRATDLTQQHEAVPTAESTGTACATRTTGTGTGRGGLALDSRVDTGLDSGLQLFDISQLGIGGRRRRIARLGRDSRAFTGRDHLFGQSKRAVAPERKNLTIAEANRDRSPGTSNQLLAGIDPIAFD
ncbi:hypothetical protein AAFN46_05165 [Pseudomonas sp. CAU 1711]|uniref:hypothetical protein n=1 Tax=Pseudomonas sp. CAU 1711 TaxID=3140356 RepID=UPI0032601E43